MNIQTYNKKEVLVDGSSVVVRAIKPEDKSALREAFSELSIESICARFFQRKQSLSVQELEYFTEVDFVNHVAIGVGLLHGGQTVPIGIGRYIVNRSDPAAAEIALTVDDDYQGIGVGSLLLKHLSHIARNSGIERLYATVFATNDRMMHVFRRSRLPVQQSTNSGLIEVTLALKS